MIGPSKLKDLNPIEVEKIIGRNKRNLDLVKASVQNILNDIREKGDGAILKYTKLYDGVDLTRERLKATKGDITQAYEQVPKGVVGALKEAAKNIAAVHRRQLPKAKVLKNRGGIWVKEVFKPIDRVGVYVPGGKAAYPSTALMTVIPAKIAGVGSVVACTPPLADGEIAPAVMVALDLAGADEVYRVGGVQAIGAMAYGTETIPRVDKIFGPGNIYVSAAKGLVYSQVGVDFLAGPSEILIYADETADPRLIASDMVSQAEHDHDSVAVLVTTSEKTAHDTKDEIERVRAGEKRASIIEEALSKNGAILMVEGDNEALVFINRFAPEHLELMVKKPSRLLEKVRNAGSISLGTYTPVPATDYAVGSNHILPTAGDASFTSSLTVSDFLKTTYVQSLSKGGLQKLRKTILTLAEYEGLAAHVHSVEARFIGDVRK